MALIVPVVLYVHIFCYLGQAVGPVRLSPSFVFFSVPDKLTLEVVASGAHDGIFWTRDGKDFGTRSQFVYFHEIYFKEPTTSDDYGEYNIIYSGRAGTEATIFAIPLGQS